jgi:toxin ParE1/3/4
MKVRWLRPAVESLDAIYEHIAAENPAAARRVFRHIVDATCRLGQFPMSCPAGRIAGTRELALAGLPYFIVYHVRGDAVFILRVLHTSMNWQGTAQ